MATTDNKGRVIPIKMTHFHIEAITELLEFGIYGRSRTDLVMRALDEYLQKIYGINGRKLAKLKLRKKNETKVPEMRKRQSSEVFDDGICKEGDGSEMRE